MNYPRIASALCAVSIVLASVAYPVDDCGLVVRLESLAERGMRRAMEGNISPLELNEFSIVVINTGKRPLRFDSIRATFYQNNLAVAASTIVHIGNKERQYFHQKGKGAVNPPDVSGQPWPPLPPHAGAAWTLEAANTYPSYHAMKNRSIAVKLSYQGRVVAGPCTFALKD